MVCLLVAIFSSYKLLAVPDLKPGDIAPFNEKAPRDAKVIDTRALKEKKNFLKDNIIQVIDKNQSDKLERKVLTKIKRLRILKDSNFEENISYLNLTNLEKNWLIKVSDNEWIFWKEELKKASKKMLSQGIINTLALDQLNQASSIQLIDLGITDAPERSLGAKLLSTSFYQKSNLKTYIQKTNALVQNLINREYIKTINIKEGSIITKKGETINSEQFDKEAFKERYMSIYHDV